MSSPKSGPQARPLSPFMLGQYYRFQLTSVLSFAHRITGLGLTLGMTPALAAPAQAQQAATIQARTAPGGVAVTWRLAQPTTEVAFLDPDIIRTLWTVTTPGLSLTDNEVARLTKASNAVGE